MLLKKITKLLLFITLAAPPFVKVDSLIFPFISGKVYLFRLLVELSFLCWIFLMIQDKRYRPNFKNVLIIAIILYLAGLIITGFLGIDWINSFFSGFERGDGVIQFALLVLYFLMLISVLKSKKDWQMLLGVFLITSLLISLYSWFNYKEQIRLSGNFGNSAYLGAYMIIAIGFTAIILEDQFSERKPAPYHPSDARIGAGFWPFKLNILLLFFLGLLFFLTLFFSQTRGCYVGLAGGFLILTILSILFLRKEKKRLVIILCLILLIGIISLGLVFAFKNSHFIKTSETLSRLTDITEFWRLSSIKERLLTWQIAIKGFKDKPFFGWGSENFGSIFNKYYDYRVGLEEPWFDRAHNQFLEVLATGGIFLFSLYLLWIFSVFYLIFKIFKEKKLLSIILASIYSAYLIQGLFLFDTFPLYLALFSFFGFVYFEYQSVYHPEDLSIPNNIKEREARKKNPLANYILIVAATCLIAFLIYTTAWIPYRANSLTLKCFIFTLKRNYDAAGSFLNQALKINSPYVFLDVRKRGGWEFLAFLEKIDKEKEDIESITKLYKIITLELEKVADRHPFDPQIYYVLGRAYRLGSEKLSQDDLGKAEKILRRSFNYSQLRADYFDELAKVLVAQGKFDEAEDLVKGYIKKVNREDPFLNMTLGNLYFIEEKYDLAMTEYQKAKEKGYDFFEILEEYNRYLSTAEQLGDYEKVVEICLLHFEKKGPDAQTFFNLAVAYMNLNENQKAKEFFYKALELNKDFQEWQPFFDNL
jgi:O-antigen ligase